MNHSDDDKLKGFLKANMPEAPQRQPEELNRILRRLDLDEPVIFKKRVWFAFSGAVAAGVAAFFIAIQRSPDATPAVQVVIEEELGFEDELPALEVGEDYLSLASLSQ